MKIVCEKCLEHEPGLKKFISSNGQKNKKVLEDIMKIIQRHNLKRPMDNNRTFYRARAFTEGNRILNDLRRMGPPKPQDIKNISSRMSPPGYPVFYASSDEKLALAEISQTGKEGIAYVGKFQLIKGVKVIDLIKCRNRELPSFFDPDKNTKERRNELIFLAELSESISKPIEKDGCEHTDYVPTQILAEYIKTKSFKGILYPSSKIKKTDQFNVVLFLTQDNCYDNKSGKSKNNKYLSFEKSKTTHPVPYEIK